MTGYKYELIGGPQDGSSFFLPERVPCMGEYFQPHRNSMPFSMDYIDDAMAETQPKRLRYVHEEEGKLVFKGVV